MSLIKKLAGETLVYGLGSVLPRVLNFLLLAPYFTRILKESSYGIHGIMYSFSALLLVLYTYRMETAFFRFGSKKGQLIQSFSTASIGVFASAFLFTFPILFFSKSISGVLTSTEDQRYVIYFAFIILFDALMALPFAKLRLENRPLRFSFLKIINVLINAFVIIFLIELLPIIEANPNWTLSNIYNTEHKLDYIFIANLLASGLILMAISTEYKGIQLKFHSNLFKKMLHYALPLVIVGFAGIINQLLDRYFVKEFIPGDVVSKLEQSGIYNACVKIAVLMLLFTTAFNYAAEPFFFKNADRKDAPEIYARVTQVFTIAAAGVFLLITLFIDQFKLLIGEDFREGLNIVPVLLLAYLLLGLYYNFSIWYKLKDKTHYGAMIAVIGSMITISLNWYLVPTWGYLGTTYAALSCFAVMVALAIFFGRKHYAIPYPFSKIVFTLCIALIIYFIHTLLSPLVDDVIIKFFLNSGLLIIFLGITLLLQREVIVEFIKPGLKK